MKQKKKKKQPNALPADSAARLPDTQMPRSLVQPRSDNAVTQAKQWVDRNEL